MTGSSPMTQETSQYGCTILHTAIRKESMNWGIRKNLWLFLWPDLVLGSRDGKSVQPDCWSQDWNSTGEWWLLRELDDLVFCTDAPSSFFLENNAKTCCHGKQLKWQWLQINLRQTPGLSHTRPWVFPKSWGYPQASILNGIFHYKPSILGDPPCSEASTSFLHIFFSPAGEGATDEWWVELVGRGTEKSRSGDVPSKILRFRELDGNDGRIKRLEPLCFGLETMVPCVFFSWNQFIRCEGFTLTLKQPAQVPVLWVSLTLPSLWGSSGSTSGYLMP